MAQPQIKASGTIDSQSKYNLRFRLWVPLRTIHPNAAAGNRFAPADPAPQTMKRWHTTQITSGIHDNTRPPAIPRPYAPPACGEPSPSLHLGKKSNRSEASFRFSLNLSFSHSFLSVPRSLKRTQHGAPDAACCNANRGRPGGLVMNADPLAVEVRAAPGKVQSDSHGPAKEAVWDFFQASGEFPNLFF